MPQQISFCSTGIECITAIWWISDKGQICLFTNCNVGNWMDKHNAKSIDYLRASCYFEASSDLQTKTILCHRSRVNCHNELMQWAVDYLSEWLSLLKLLPATIMWLSWWEIPSCHWVCLYFRRIYTQAWIIGFEGSRVNNLEDLLSIWNLCYSCPFGNKKRMFFCWSSISIKVLPLQTADPFWWCRMMLAYCMLWRNVWLQQLHMHYLMDRVWEVSVHLEFSSSFLLGLALADQIPHQLCDLWSGQQDGSQ